MVLKYLEFIDLSNGYKMGYQARGHDDWYTKGASSFISFYKPVYSSLSPVMRVYGLRFGLYFYSVADYVMFLSLSV